MRTLVFGSPVTRESCRKFTPGMYILEVSFSIFLTYKKIMGLLVSHWHDQNKLEALKDVINNSIKHQTSKNPTSGLRDERLASTSDSSPDESHHSCWQAAGWFSSRSKCHPHFALMSP